jgi:hypothetical protein
LFSAFGDKVGEKLGPLDQYSRNWFGFMGMAAGTGAAFLLFNLLENLAK